MAGRTKSSGVEYLERWKTNKKQYFDVSFLDLSRLYAMLHGDENCQLGAVFTCRKRDAYHTRLCALRANCAIVVVGKAVAAGIRQASTDLNVGAVTDQGREELRHACRLDRDACRDGVGRRADTGRRRAGLANRCRPRRSRDRRMRTSTLGC